MWQIIVGIVSICLTICFIVDTICNYLIEKEKNKQKYKDKE